MRTYDIVDTASDAVLRQETVEDSIRPTLLAGQIARAASPAQPAIHADAAEGVGSVQETDELTVSAGRQIMADNTSTILTGIQPLTFEAHAE